VSYGQDEVFGPPFKRRVLDKLGRTALLNKHLDVTQTIHWLMRQYSEAQMTDAVVRAWRASSLPLREWAERISGVAAWSPESDDDLKLQVTLGGPAERVVLQDAPLDREYLDSLLSGFPKAPPSVVRDLGLSAPGFSLHANSSLLPHRCYQARLGEVGRWVNRMLDGRARSLGEPRLPSNLSARWLMEVANDPFGNWFILGMDESVWFWDHEEIVGLQQCEVGLPEMITHYLESPDCLDDSDFMGIEETSVACVEVPAATQEPTGLDRLRKTIPSLTALSCLAIAVRACQREHPSRHSRVLSWWGEHAAKLDEVIGLCREVCLTGSRLDRSQTHRIEEAIQQAQAAWWARTRSLPRDAYPCGMYAALVRSAALGAASLPDVAQAQRAAERCGNRLTANRESWWPSVFADIEYLRSLGLGPAGSVGRPIPAEFFERPL